MDIKKIIVMSVSILLVTTQLYARVESIVVNNESGVAITVLIEYEDDSSRTRSLSPGEKQSFYAEDKCIYGISIYSDRWKSVRDIQPDDKLVIPKSWNRCQSWIFTIKKRSDETVHVASKQIVSEDEAS